MKSFCSYLALTFLIFLSFQGISSPKTSFKLSPDTILVGDYVKVNLEFSYSKGSELVLDNIKSFAKSFEFVKIEKEESSEKGNNIDVKLALIYTSFDSGQHVIPPFPIVIKKGELYDTLFIGDTTILEVINPILPENFKGYDIKGVKAYANPIWLTLLIILATALIIITLVWFLLTREKVKEVLPFYQSVEIPYELAIKELRKIKQKGLLEKGEVKEYYTQLTNIVRIYIERSTGTATMEKTSVEILNTLPQEFNKPNLKGYLQKLFNIADLVKFAKYTPLEIDNELSWQNAYKFIEESRPKKEMIEEQNKETQNKKE